MIPHYYKKIVLSMLIATINFGFGQTPILSTQARVSVLTCGTGNESILFLDIRPSDQRSIYRLGL
jgi:hypothetical protein